MAGNTMALRFSRKIIKIVLNSYSKKANSLLPYLLIRLNEP
jgi:hypothetical protein